MPVKFINSKSTVFHPDSETDSQEFVLIFGDRVETTGEVANKRNEVIYRGRVGWVLSERLMSTPPLEMYFIDVGQGDSIFVVTPNDTKILIDGGRGDEAFQFLVWKYRLDLDDSADVNIDLLILSHTDMDHINGLISIVGHDRINIDKIYHSGIAKFKATKDIDKLGDVQDTANGKFLVTSHRTIEELKKYGEGDEKTLTETMQRWCNVVDDKEIGANYNSVTFNGDIIDEHDVAGNQLLLHVLGPNPEMNNGSPKYKWFGSDRETVNGHSVVLRLDYDKVRILFPGDVNRKGAKYLIDGLVAADKDPRDVFGAHIFKAPHHGSHDFNLEFLKAVNPQISVISSGESPDHGHPRANFLGTIGKVSRSEKPLLFSTELVANFAVDEDAMAPDVDVQADPTDPAMIGQARRRFKKRLNGIINVRTDGEKIYCARRVAAGYQFVTYMMNPYPAKTSSEPTSSRR